jgi:hypothetical protein
MSGGGTGLMSGGGLSIGSGGRGMSGFEGCSIMTTRSATTLPDMVLVNPGVKATAEVAESAEFCLLISSPTVSLTPDISLGPETLG